MSAFIGMLVISLTVTLTPTAAPAQTVAQPVAVVQTVNLSISGAAGIGA